MNLEAARKVARAFGILTVGLGLRVKLFEALVCYDFFDLLVTATLTSSSSLVANSELDFEFSLDGCLSSSDIYDLADPLSSS